MTNPTPHGQVPEALPAIQRFEVVDCIDSKHVPAVIPNSIGPWVRYEDHAAEFRRLHAYCQELEAQVIRDCMSTQQGAADGFFLLLPQRPKPEAPAGTAGLDWDAYSGAQMLAFGRDCSDAAIAALRTQQPTPAGATPECLTCSDHGAVGNILTAEPCPDCTRLNAQPAPAIQQAGPSDEAILNRTDCIAYSPGTAEYDLELIRWYQAQGAAPQPSPTAQAAPAAGAVAGPVEWTPGPNVFKDWCSQWFGPDSDDEYLAKAVYALPPMAQRFAAAPTPAAQADSQPAPIMPRGESAAPGLRAMATNYPAGHLWDKLDAKTCIRGALEIEALRAARAKEASVLKDHQIAALVNELRDIAVQYHDTQQLRERIAHVVVPVLRAAPSVLEDAARLERERICAAIKAEDDYCVDHGDYMLDSDDCIKIVRGEWVRPDFSVDAARKQGGA